jgi:hypothetical protein
MNTLSTIFAFIILIVAAMLLGAILAYQVGVIL